MGEWMTDGASGTGGVDLDGALTRTRRRAEGIRQARRRRVTAAATAVAVLIPLGLIGTGALRPDPAEMVTADGDGSTASTTPAPVADAGCAFHEDAAACAESSPVPTGWEAARGGGRLLFRFAAPDTPPAPDAPVAVGGATVDRTRFDALPVAAAGAPRGVVVSLPCAPGPSWVAATLGIAESPLGPPTAELTVIHENESSACAPDASPVTLTVPLAEPYRP